MNPYRQIFICKYFAGLRKHACDARKIKQVSLQSAREACSALFCPMSGIFLSEEQRMIAILNHTFFLNLLRNSVGGMPMISLKTLEK